MEDKTKSGFAITGLILLESNFKRENNVQFVETVQNNMHIETEVQTKDASIMVLETVTISQKYEKLEQVSIMVKMAGVFERVGESKLEDLEQFGKINGAAIIFPYIREHITNLSLKAGIPPIILPPVNFTKMQGNNR